MVTRGFTGRGSGGDTSRRIPPGQHLVEQTAEAVQVCTSIQHPAALFAPCYELARRRQEWTLLAAGNPHTGINLRHGVDSVLLKRQQPLTAEFVQVVLGAEVRHAGRERRAQLVEQSVKYLRHLLDRLEDSATGRLLPGAFHVEIPAARLAQARATAAVLGDEVWKRQPWACGAEGLPVLPMTDDPVEALLGRTWRPTLSVTGAEGLPALSSAGNVLRPFTAFKLSLRLPPLVDAATAVQELKTLLEDNAPYQARVTWEGASAASGWNAPPITPWFEQALNAASQAQFGAPCGYIGQGGTIPLMNMLSQGFPKAQMMVCGVLGPKSNAHGPNEFLHVPYAKRLTAAVAQVIAAMPGCMQAHAEV
mgnify:CR=1 FL=1